eukprot:scaffold51_cov401-Prasinococcus_capsulatus_cf.AAC.18
MPRGWAQPSGERARVQARPRLAARAGPGLRYSGITAGLALGAEERARGANWHRTVASGLLGLGLRRDVVAAPSGGPPPSRSEACGTRGRADPLGALS